jgi:alpha-L-rhamnosidase
MLTCGSEATVVRDVEVDHCKGVGSGPHAMLRLKLRTDTPQLYENIRFHDITLLGKGAIIEVAPWTQYADLQGHAPPTHKVQDITLSNIAGAFGTFGSIRANRGDVIQNLTLENFDVQLTRGVPAFNGVTDLTVKNVKVNGKEYTGPAQ